MLFIVLFIILPLLEIATFIYVGGHIGVLNTLLLSFCMAILGGVIVKYQGFETLTQARDAFARGEVPSKALFHGLVLMLAAGMLITPGFVTDAVGFMLLIPQVREALRLWLLEGTQVNVMGFNLNVTEIYRTVRPQRPGPEGDVIDAAYRDITPKGPDDKP